MITWPDSTPRSMNGPFAILYAPRATPKPAPPKKIKRNRTAREKTIAALRDNTHSPFCVTIATQEQADRTRAIGGQS
jgi:hypothetical protein